MKRYMFVLLALLAFVSWQRAISQENTVSSVCGNMTAPLPQTDFGPENASASTTAFIPPTVDVNGTATTLMDGMKNVVIDTESSEELTEQNQPPSRNTAAEPKPKLQTKDRLEIIAEKYFAGKSKVFLAICKAESGLNPYATHRNSNGSVDRGIAQINSCHLWRVGNDPAKLFDPETNIRVAHEIYAASGSFRPWTVYRSGAYRRYLGKEMRLACSVYPSKNKNKTWKDQEVRQRPDRQTMYTCKSGQEPHAMHPFDVPDAFTSGWSFQQATVLSLFKSNGWLTLGQSQPNCPEMDRSYWGGYLASESLYQPLGQIQILIAISNIQNNENLFTILQQTQVGSPQTTPSATSSSHPYGFNTSQSTQSKCLPGLENDIVYCRQTIDRRRAIALILSGNPSAVSRFPSHSDPTVGVGKISTAGTILHSALISRGPPGEAAPIIIRARVGTTRAIFID